MSIQSKISSFDDYIHLEVKQIKINKLEIFYAPFESAGTFSTHNPCAKLDTAQHWPSIGKDFAELWFSHFQNGLPW